MILHITNQFEWETAVARGVYIADSLASEGFIHCSTVEQVLGPANEPEKVAAPIVYEDCYETGQAFPHIYGPLNLDAVVQIIPLPPEPDGSFTLPPGLRPSSEA
jgi:uncharacterized protein (DUF952 family)